MSLLKNEALVGGVSPVRNFLYGDFIFSCSHVSFAILVTLLNLEKCHSTTNTCSMYQLCSKYCYQTIKSFLETSCCRISSKFIHTANYGKEKEGAKVKIWDQGNAASNHHQTLGSKKGKQSAVPVILTFAKINDYITNVLIGLFLWDNAAHTISHSYLYLEHVLEF